MQLGVAIFAGAILIWGTLSALHGEPAEEVWRDATELEIEGKGWSETEDAYDRFPARAKGKVPDGVWELSKHSAGLCVRFQTNAPTVSVRWDLRSESLAMPHMPATGVSGVDLYQRAANGSWQFVQNGRPTQPNGNAATFRLPTPSNGETECLLYLPLYNGVKRVQIGVPMGVRLNRAAARPEERRRPVAVYGTSIAQGGCASRPGLAHVAILGRLLDCPMINLGFSGSGRMEPAVSETLAELDPAVYVIDCLWNMGGMEDAEFTQRLTTLVQTLRRAHPRTPILFVGQSLVQPGQAPTAKERSQATTIRRLKAQGVPELHLFAGKTLLGDDGEGTVDGVHPNDLGMLRHAQALAPAVKKLLAPR